MSKYADTYVVELEAKTSSYTSQMEEAKQATEETDEAMGSAEKGAKNLGTKMTTVGNSTGKFSSAINTAKSKIAGIAGALTTAASGVANFGSKLSSAMSSIASSKIVTSALSAIKTGISEMYDTLEDGTEAWTTFEANMKMNGHTTEEIEAAKKSMQDYASATVYSASEMASAYSQLDAVGVQNVDDLVKGIGGLAASASDPSQAMTSLMTQITQAAGKSTIAWQDFRIMLEQAPAGVSAVAKTMGMTTSELVSNIQDGKVATTDFLNAVASTGTNANFTALSTQFKTVSQAIDGAKESLSNKLQPAFSNLQTAGIRAVEAISGAFEKLTPYIEKVISYITAGVNAIASGIAKITGIKLSSGTANITANTGGTISTSELDAAEETANATDATTDSTNAATKAAKANTRAVKEQTKAQAAYNATALSFDVSHKLGGGSTSAGSSSDDAGSGTVTAAAATTAAVADTGTSALDTLGDIDTTLADITTEEEVQPAAIKAIKSVFDKVKPILSSVLTDAKELAGTFKDGFKLGLGDTSGQFESLKNSVKSLKDNFLEFLNDPGIQAGSKTLVNNVVGTLGTMTGSIARVGLNIGTGLLGGISQYVDGNKDRIKEHILAMFDIGNDLSGLVSRTFQSLGTLSDSLATPQAQALTANILGIFADFKMSLHELLGKAFVDIGELILDPINDNIDGIKTALDGFISYYATITEGIKTLTDSVMDHLNEVYDASVGPLLDTVKEALSGLLEVILDDWNTYVAPVLDKVGEKVKEVIEDHLAPALENVIDVIGRVCDIISPIVEKYIAPLVSILIDTLFPPVSAFLGFLATTGLEALEVIIDAIGGVIGVISDLLGWIGKLIDKLPSLEGISSWFHNGTKTSWNIGSTGTASSISGYAGGGQVNNAQIFMARENGMAELVGNIGGATSVMNNDQIVTAVSSGVAQAVAGVMSQYQTNDSGQAQDIVIQVDSEELARAVQRGNKRYNTRTNPTFAYN